MSIPAPIHDIAPPPEEAAEVTAPPIRGRYRKAFRTGKARIGLALILTVGLVALVGPFFLPYGPYEQGANALTTPSGDHLLGTDQVGRDLFSRVLAGTRVDLLITVIAVPIAGVLGSLAGLLIMVSRRLGNLFQRVFDVFLGIPAVILGVGVAIAVEPSIKSVVATIVLVAMPIFGRQTGVAVMGQMSMDYVAAAQVLGFPKRRIVLRHVLPNIIDVIFVRTAVVMALAITVEGGLSVIGLGIQSPQPSLGSMIKDGSSYLFSVPTYALAPVGVVILLVVGYTMVADALNQSVLRE
jgi:peptide/nickel transport system permease protein